MIKEGQLVVAERKETFIMPDGLIKVEILIIDQKKKSTYTALVNVSAVGKSAESLQLKPHQEFAVRGTPDEAADRVLFKIYQELNINLVPG